MSDKNIENRNGSVTPSTAKLNQLRAGKGPGMLTPEEIELLRKSAKEIAEVHRLIRETNVENNAASNFVGILANKTTKVATLQEIEEATSIGWAKDELNKED